MSEWVKITVTTDRGRFESTAKIMSDGSYDEVSEKVREKVNYDFINPQMHGKVLKHSWYYVSGQWAFTKS